MLRHREKQLERLRSKAVGPFPPDQWYNQTLDHFDVLNSGYWQQRFWTNESFWDGTGPVFFYIEGEGAGSPADVVSGQHVELAQMFGALVVALEHRFYGASIPTADLSEDNLRVLSSHQSIADISRFIREYLFPTYNLSSSNTIVTFGGSYPGALSAWTRLRLPHLVSVAFSTSSPVQAVADFTGYNDVVSASLANLDIGGSPQCLENIQSAFQIFDAAMTGNTSSRTAMSQLMSSCAPAVSDLDAMWLANNVAGNIMGVVQYNDDMPGSYDVRQLCAVMTDSTMTPINALAQATLQMQGGVCADSSWNDFVAQLRNVTADPTVTGVGLRQWTWQTCTQFGYYQTCENGTKCPFSKLMTLASNFLTCTQGFDNRVGPAVNVDRINFTNDYYGGQTDFKADRVIFTNGLVDPWHHLSVTPGYNSSLVGNAAIIIPTGAHCRQMFPSMPSDPPDVVAARKQAAGILADWLQNA